MRIDYPILDPTTLEPNPQGIRFRRGFAEEGAVVQEMWGDYVCSLSADHTTLAINGTATIIATFTKYDGSALDASLPGPANVTFSNNGQTVTVAVANGQASTTITSSTPTTETVTAYGAGIVGASIGVTFE